MSNEMGELFDHDLKRLKEFTKACRENMHEPDEQELTAMFGPSAKSYAEGDMVYPRSFDNACCGPDGDMGFWLINTDTRKSEWFNLACIVALARKAVL